LIELQKKIFVRRACRPPTASSTPRLGVRNPHPKLQSLLSHERPTGTSKGLQIWPIHSEGPTEQKPIKIWEKRERGHIQWPPSFKSIPYYLRNW